MPEESSNLRLSTKMVQFLRIRLFSLAISLAVLSLTVTGENKIKSAVFLSPVFVLQPGSVADKYYYNVDFPQGHIAIKEFTAEVVDEAGNPVPLHETYLHHWVMVRYHQRTTINTPPNYHPHHHPDVGFHQSDTGIVRNSGLCGRGLGQYFGLGSETRRTETRVPDPYGIEVGDPATIPDGYEERWLLNVHAIDTRGAIDGEERLGCTECRCDLYNVTRDSTGIPLPADYVGGLRCCYDKTQCRVRDGGVGGGSLRRLYMKYTVKWVDWEDDGSIIPVKIYILDVTDTWKKSDGSRGLDNGHDCKIEYSIESCSSSVANEGCVDTKTARLSLPASGDVIYGVAHQHTGGIGSTLYGEDGRVICSSMPTYGEGKEVGNEAGYIVGMTTCYPRPGTVKISAGETLLLESNYSAAQRHTGVMGLFYLLVVDPSPSQSSRYELHEKATIPSFVWGMVLFGVAVAVIAAVAYRRSRGEGKNYQPLVV